MAHSKFTHEHTSFIHSEQNAFSQYCERETTTHSQFRYCCEVRRLWEQFKFHARDTLLRERGVLRAEQKHKKVEGKKELLLCGLLCGLLCAHAAARAQLRFFSLQHFTAECAFPLHGNFPSRSVVGLRLVCFEFIR